MCYRRGGRSGSGERGGQVVVDEVDVGWSESSWTGELLGCLSWPQDIDLGDPERSGDQRPVGVDETQHAPDRAVLGLRAGRQRAGYELHLPKHTIEQLGAVAGADHQHLGAGPQEPAVYPQVRPPGESFRVDDVHTAGGDGEMVDVGPGAGDPPIVQQPHTFAGELVQALGESLLADGAALPGPGALRLVGQRQDQPADTGVRGADGGFPLRLPPPVFTPGRGAGDAIDKGTPRGPVRQRRGAAATSGRDPEAGSRTAWPSGAGLSGPAAPAQGRHSTFRAVGS